MNIGKKKKQPKNLQNIHIKRTRAYNAWKIPCIQNVEMTGVLINTPHTFHFKVYTSTCMYNKELHSLTHQQINIYAEYFFPLIYWFLFSTRSHMSAAAIFMPEFVYRIWTVCSCGSYLKVFFLVFFFYKIILTLKKKIT